jgi:TLD
VIIVQDSWGYVFGGYIAHALEKKAFYYGNGESFVFSLSGSSAPQCYKWTGKNDMFMISDSNCFAMGGGGGGFAFQLDDELDTGVSDCSDTYNNGQLSSSEFFKCLNLEVWLLEGVGFSV